MILRNSIYQGYNGRQGLYDLFLQEEYSQKPLLVFVHGYMGYKDWGAWNLMANEFYHNGYNFAKLNLIHNGTTIQNPTIFDDLDAFGKGGYLSELRDIQLFLDHLEKHHEVYEFILIGHSRGGGMVLLAGDDHRVSQIHCLSPICDIESRFPQGEELQKWKNTNVYYKKNGRTNQDLPHYYSQYEDFLANKEELDIKAKCTLLNKPVFVYHGEEDLSVLPVEGENVANWTNGKFYSIKDTAHTFGASEPWEKEEMPSKLHEVVKLIQENVGNV